MTPSHNNKAQVTKVYLLPTLSDLALLPMTMPWMWTYNALSPSRLCLSHHIHFLPPQLCMRVTCRTISWASRLKRSKSTSFALHSPRKLLGRCQCTRDITKRRRWPRMQPVLPRPPRSVSRPRSLGWKLDWLTREPWQRPRKTERSKNFDKILRPLSTNQHRIQCQRQSQLKPQPRHLPRLADHRSRMQRFRYDQIQLSDLEV